MNKKLLLAAAGLLVSVSPVLTTAKADGNGWGPVSADAAWSYNGYSVQRLALSPRSVGPVSLGDAVLVAEPPANCYGTDCGLMNVSLFRNGLRAEASGVPSAALSADRYAKNGNRFLYVKPTADGVFAVYEWNLATGTVSTLVSNLSMPGASNVDILVDNRGTFFLTADVRFSNANTAFTQRALYVYDAQARAVRATVGNGNWTDRRIDMLDAQNGIVFAKMAFPDGSSQLFLFDSNRVNYDAGRVTEVPFSWSDAAGGTTQYGRIISAHTDADVTSRNEFTGAVTVDNGATHATLEYFSHFVRQTWTTSDDKPTVYKNDLLTWYRPVDQAVKLDRSTNRLAWLSPDDVAMASTGSASTILGSSAGGTLVAENGAVYFGTSVRSSDATSGSPFRVSDATSGLTLAGLDEGGNVYIGSATSKLRVGYGSSAAISDKTHVYWRGVDGNVYVAAVTGAIPTVAVTAPAATPAQLPAAKLGARALRAEGSNAIWLVDDKFVRHYVPSERVYQAWFGAWTNVQTVSAQMLQTFAIGDNAALPPGTLLRRANDSRVYAVAKDGTVRLIANAQTASALFGTDWTARVLTATEVDFVPYSVGSDIGSVAAGANLF